MTRLTASREVEFRAPADPPGRVLGEQRLAELPTGHPARDRVLAHLLSAEDGIDVSLADVLEAPVPSTC